MPRGLFGVHFGWSLFLPPHPQASRRPRWGHRFCWKTNAFLYVLGEIALPCSVALVWLGASSTLLLREWDPRNIKNSLKIMVWDIFWGPIWGINLDHENAKIVPMQRGARSFFCRNAPMQRGAHFLISDFPFGVLCWAQRGRQKHCKTNAFLIIFRMKGTLGAIATWIPKSKIDKIRPENQCFVWLPWELFGVNVGWSYLCLPILGPQGGLAAFVKFVINVMVFWCFLHLSAKRCGAGCNRKCREVPKNNEKTTRK